MSELGEQDVAGPRRRTARRPPPAASPGAGTAARRLRLGIWLPALVGFGLFALGWELYADAHPFVIPSIESIWTALRENAHENLQNFLTTLREVAIGGLGGILAAFVLAVVMAELPIFERALMPLVVVLMVTPIVAIAPALVIAFGFGAFPKYLATGLVVFYPMLVNTLAGMRNIDERTLDVFTTLHASRFETFWRLRLPSSLPFVFAGLRIALPLSVVGATIAEISAAGQQAGLGSQIQVASSNANLPVIWSSIALLCLLGILLVGLLALIRSKALWWDNASAKGR